MLTDFVCKATEGAFNLLTSSKKFDISRFPSTNYVGSLESRTFKAFCLKVIYKLALNSFDTSASHQLEPETRSAILGNAQTIICFRLGLDDAKVMEKEFYPVFSYDDFVSLPKYQIYLKLCIDGTESKGLVR